MTLEHIEQVITEYIINEFQHGDRNEGLTNDRELITDGIIDSLGIFTIISFIQKEFSIQLKAEDVVLENFESVNAIKRLVLSRT